MDGEVGWVGGERVNRSLVLLFCLLLLFIVHVVVVFSP